MSKFKKTTQTHICDANDGNTIVLVYSYKHKNYVLAEKYLHPQRNFGDEFRVLIDDSDGTAYQFGTIESGKTLLNMLDQFSVLKMAGYNC